MVSDTSVGGIRTTILGPTAIDYISIDPPALYFRGYNITDLAEACPPSEEIAYLLIYGYLPNKAEYAAFLERLDCERRQVDLRTLEIIAETCREREDCNAMDLLALGLSRLSALYSKRGVESIDDLMHAGIVLMAQAPVMVAGIAYARRGTRLELDFDAAGGTYPSARFFLSMAGKEFQSEEVVSYFNTMMWLHASHELNNSTFTAISCASSLPGTFSAIASAANSLKGPLHGGASTDVIDMLLAIKNLGLLTYEEIFCYIREEYFDRGRRVPGFGHPVYEKGDPRAHILKERLHERVKIVDAESEVIYKIAEHVECAVAELKPSLKTNMDFWAAPLYYSLGLPPEMTTALFAMNRLPGWIAYLKEYREQYLGRENRGLVRPRAKYVGVALGQRYVPIEQRL